MTTQPKPDSSSLVLDGSDLDLLELVLGDAVDNALAVANDARVLTDVENTPLAELAPAQADGVSDATPLRQFHAGNSRHWDARLRRPARDVRNSVAGTGDVLGIAITDFPTIDDLHRVKTIVDSREPGTVMWAIFVGRESGRIDSGPEGPALVRAVTQLVQGLDRAAAVVIPWSPGAQPGSLQLSGVDVSSRKFIHRILTGYGADDVLDVAATRPEDENERIADLDQAWREAATEIYPAESVDELEHLNAAGKAADEGLVILLSGLSGSGKSTIAHALSFALPARVGRQSTLLDGDEVRQMLSAGLGFDRESRELNVKRIGYVAGLIAHHGGTAIAAPIAPFAGARAYVRAQAEANGRFLLVYVSTPLEVCEARDRKGLYAKARAGEIAEFTGISSPYEVPDDADLTIDTSVTSVEDAVDLIVHGIDHSEFLASG